MKQAVELGINFWDTANVYSDGNSEEIKGPAIKEYSRRDAIVLATKINGRMRKGPNWRWPVTPRNIFEKIDNSLRRLGSDYVDLYQDPPLGP